MTPLTAPLASPPDAAALTRPPTAAERAGSASMITSDFETFLKMLTTQIQNQDPLNPMDPSDFAVQLATFSSVEQQVRTNQLLEGMVTQTALGELAGLVGMSVQAPGPQRFDGDALTLTLPAVDGADSARLVVRNTLGQVVETVDVPVAGGMHVWRGLGPDGLQMPPGDYAFEVSGLSEGNVVSTRSVPGFAEVVEARRDGAATVLVLATGREVPFAEVNALRGAARR